MWSFRTFVLYFFFFNDTATTEIYTLSLHDALPISTAGRLDRARAHPSRARPPHRRPVAGRHGRRYCGHGGDRRPSRDRKSTRLNSSHDQISYAVFCLKKKKSTHKWTAIMPFVRSLL